MSRFQTGQKHPFIRYRVWLRDSDGNRTEIIHSLTPNGEDTVGVEIEYLTCESEHDVPLEYREDETAKGYIFTKDNFEHKFHNQYPYASYGQASTYGDWIVSSFYETDDGVKEQEYISARSELNSIDRHSKNNSPLPEYLAEIKELILTSLTDNGFKLEETDISKKFSKGIGYKSWKIVPV